MTSQDQSVAFPLYVLIPDEQAFLAVASHSRLQYFEAPDINEATHFAWDLDGRMYKLSWDKSDGVIVVQLLRNGIDDFASAISMANQRRPRFHLFAAKRCSADELAGVLKTMRIRLQHFDSPDEGR